MDNQKFSSFDKQRFLMDQTGIIIKHTIEGIRPMAVVDQRTRDIVEFLKKNPEAKITISKIKEQLKSENPNDGVLFILKSRVKKYIDTYI
jgi:hypothetical protein